MSFTGVFCRRAGRTLLRVALTFLPFLVPAASFQVLNTNDAGLGSLRQAILDANATPGSDVITFNISGNGTRTLMPVTPLPPVLESLVLDGATQPGYTGQPLIELTGTRAGNNAGLRLLSGDTLVRGLALNGFGGSGIQIEGPGANVIQGCCLGTDAAGVVALPNGLEGIWIYNSSGNVIGGTNAGERNIISGNSDSGIYVQNGAENMIVGNYIGTTWPGTAALPNRNNGIVLYGAPYNKVGVAASGARNVISGNGASGIVIIGSAAVSNSIEGNYIGTGRAGVAALGNGADGITISGAGHNRIGGTDPGKANLVSGNGKAGIAISGSGAVDNILEGNLVGISSSGNAAVGNGYAGIWLSGASSNVIGGSAPGARNVVSGNFQDGILLGTNSVGNRVSGNYIGTDSTGASAISNAYSGIVIHAACSNNIGGMGSAGRNVISGNGLYGILLSSGSGANEICGNFIGPDRTGANAVPNGRSGIRVESGGNHFGPGNTISGNLLDGIVFSGAAASNNVVQGNFIGTIAAGNNALPNGRAGIGIAGAPLNTIGGPEPGSGNVLSANRDAGIYIIGASATGNQILGNRIGTDFYGSSSLGNALEGIYLENAVGNTIGNASPGCGNQISGNHTRGVYATNASWNSIQGNCIGLGSDNLTPLPNSFHNVETEAGSINNNIEANTIAYAPAPYCGIRIRDGSYHNVIMENSVYSNGGLGIDLGSAGVSLNDPCDSDGGANDLQNYPLLTEAVSGPCTFVRGLLNSSANRTFTIQYFASPSCDSSGSGEGRVWLGKASIITDSSCRADFATKLPLSVSSGWFITATATDQEGSTSEFSACVPVYPAPVLAIRGFSESPEARIILNWTNTPPNFLLKATTNLTTPVNWETVTNPPVLANGVFTLSVDAGPGQRFYTLQAE